MEERDTKKLVMDHLHLKDSSSSSSSSSEVSMTPFSDYRDMLSFLEAFTYGTGQITRLSIRQIYRLQSVCKLWHEVLVEFLRKPWPQKAITSHCFYRNIHEHEEERWIFMANYFLRKDLKWRTLVFCEAEGELFKFPHFSTSFGYMKKVITSFGYMNKVICRKDWHITSVCRMQSLRGLIFALVMMRNNKGISKYSVIVFNCITGYSKLLPSPEYTCKEEPRFKVSLHPNNICGYYIILAFSNQGPLMRHGNAPSLYESGDIDELLVYDSTKESWKLASDFIEPVDQDYKTLMQDDFFFYRIVDDDDFVYHMQMAYNAADDRWSSVPVVEWMEAFEDEYDY